MSAGPHPGATADRRFHLGWCAALSPSAGSLHDADLQVDVARALDRACFDLLLVEDPAVTGPPTGTDPFALVPLLTSVTEHLGVSVTASTEAYPPYVLARSLSTLDHLSAGRAGWTVGAPGEGPDDTRDERTEEYLEVVDALWTSWEPDALVMDREEGVYVDHRRVHAVDHRGKHHSSRGPLNTLPCPQGRPLVSQAPRTPRERELAARSADLVLAPAGDVAAMRSYRDDLRSRAAALGRDPDAVTVLFPVTPVLGTTTAQARALAPTGSAGAPDLVGTPDEVADRMGEVMDAVGGDGFVLRPHRDDRSCVDGIADDLVPALQRRGLVRTSFTGDTLRDHLLEF